MAMRDSTRHLPKAINHDVARQRRGSYICLTATNLHQCVEKLPSGPLIGGFGDNVIR
jgi:hypothetical protein